MEKLLQILIFTLLASAPVQTEAGVNVKAGIALPPITLAAPPVLIVLPETHVYVIPYVDEDIFFYNGWWWRRHEGNWFRSRHYNSGWAYFKSVPSFYAGIPSGWRNDYRERRWRGHQWDCRRIPHQRVERNWNRWKKNKHWEKQQTWGVHGL